MMQLCLRRNAGVACALLLLVAGLVVMTGCAGNPYNLNGNDFKPPAPQVQIPVAPNAVTATGADGQVTVSWGAVSNATSYNIYWANAAGVTQATGTKIGSLTASPYPHTSLTNGMQYYYVVTAANSAGESPASAEANAMPLPAGAIAIPLTPNAATSGTLKYDTTTSLTLSFDGQEVTSPGTAVVSPLQQSQLATPLPSTANGSRPKARVKVRGRSLLPIDAGCTFIAGFKMTTAPTSITSFATPAVLSGAVDPTVGPGATLNLATLQNSTWVAAATLVIRQDGSLAQNLPSVDVPGLLGPGQFVVCKPATTNIVSNFGIALIGDDSNGSGESANTVQVIHLYDSKGAPLATPTVSYLSYPEAYDIDGQALTPDGSQGILVDGGNTVRFFSQLQTGTPVASDYTLDVSEWGYDGDSIAIMPDGNNAVVSADSNRQLILVTDILSGAAKVAGTITVPEDRDSVVISADGKVLMARSYTGLTVFSITGTDAAGFKQTMDAPSLGSYWVGDGRGGMAISPMDSSRALIVSTSDAKIHMLTGLPDKPVEVPALDISVTDSSNDLSVSITPDGKTAIVGTENGLLMLSGVDTGNLAIVPCPAGLAGCSNGLYSPTYKDGNGMDQNLTGVITLGITLDGMYVAAADAWNSALLVIPIAKNTFGATVGLVNTGIAIPSNDQMLIH